MATSDESPATPPVQSTSGATRSFCTPEVVGLSATGERPVSVECPSGWTRRDSFAPISGRFTSRAELVDALCVAINAATDPRSTKDDLGIDFNKNDVFATPYDPSTRAVPAVNRRTTNELWIRVLESSCPFGTSASTSLATALFIVPKEAKVDEQRCSAACE